MREESKSERGVFGKATEKRRGRRARAVPARIENSTVNDAGGFFVAAGCVRCMDVPSRKFRHPGDRMNSVNKKCALPLCAHEQI